MAQLMRSEWEQELIREGLTPVTASEPSAPDAMVCPACGANEPLVDGACVDCGLMLG